MTIEGAFIMFKKLFLLGAAGFSIVTVTNAMADNSYAPNPHRSNANTKMYIELHSGYARQNYFDSQSWNQSAGTFGTNLNNNNNAFGGFSAGADAGYQINRHFSAELGWFHLPSVNVMAQGTAPSYLKSWVLYLAAKYMMPIQWMNDTDAFFKLGAAYRKANLDSAAVTAAATSTGKSTFVRPMFATGLDYHFNESLIGVIQYAYFMGARNSFAYSTANSGALGTVAANVFTLGLGYQFTV